jgi:5-methylcytosine-specific restriction endonuclease McrA
LSEAIKRAKDQGLPASLGLEDLHQALNDFEGKCAYCRKEKATDIDHFIPYCFGGGTTIDNCVPACSRCNNYKSDHHPDCLPTNPRKLISQEAVERVRTYLLIRSHDAQQAANR